MWRRALYIARRREAAPAAMVCPTSCENASGNDERINVSTAGLRHQRDDPDQTQALAIFITPTSRHRALNAFARMPVAAGVLSRNRLVNGKRQALLIARPYYFQRGGIIEKPSQIINLIASLCYYHHPQMSCRGGGQMP